MPFNTPYRDYTKEPIAPAYPSGDASGEDGYTPYAPQVRQPPIQRTGLTAMVGDQPSQAGGALKTATSAASTLAKMGKLGSMGSKLAKAAPTALIAEGAGQVGRALAGNHAKTAGFLGGAGSGAGLGATIGSVIPGVGTAIGAVAGGLIGGIKGLFGGKKKLKEEQAAKAAGGGGVVVGKNPTQLSNIDTGSPDFTKKFDEYVYGNPVMMAPPTPARALTPQGEDYWTRQAAISGLNPMRRG